MKTSKILQQLLQEHWKQAILDTKEEIDSIKARLQDLVTPEIYEAILKKIQSILNPERPKTSKAKRRPGGSNDDQE